MALSLCPRETDESMAGSIPSGPDHPRDTQSTNVQRQTFPRSNTPGEGQMTNNPPQTRLLESGHAKG